MKYLKPTYNVPQEILYSVCEAAWKLCGENLEKFSGLKGFYKEAYINNAIIAVEWARKLPEIRQTAAARTEARITLVESSKKVRANWQLLKLYITKAFDEKMVKTKLEAAGASLYGKASLYNWSAVRSLVNTADSFIKDNLDALAANENMPIAFQAIFSKDGAACVELSTNFSHLNMDKEMATCTKVDANNAIYAQVIEMLKDGQQIFRNDPFEKKQFTFRYLVSLFKSTASASLKGYIVNNYNQPIQGVTFQSQDEKYTATTDEKGYFNIARIAK